MAKEIVQGTLDAEGITYDVKIDGGKIVVTATLDVVKDIDLIPGSSAIEDMVKGLVKSALVAM